jgi:hypothetical protein
VTAAVEDVADVIEAMRLQGYILAENPIGKNQYGPPWNHEPKVASLLADLDITKPEADALSDPALSKDAWSKLHSSGSLPNADLFAITNPATGKKYNWWDTVAGEAKKAEFKTTFAKKATPVEPEPLKVPDISPAAQHALDTKFGTSGEELDSPKYSHPAIYGAALVGVANKTGTPIGDLLANLDGMHGSDKTSEFSSWLQTDKGKKWASAMHLDGAITTAPPDLKKQLSSPVTGVPETYQSVAAYTNAPPPWTASQKSSLKNYTKSFTNVQTFLRTGKAQGMNYVSPTDLKTQIANMRAGMRPLKHGVIVKRASGLKQFGVTSLPQLQKLVGKTVSDKGFMSTTLNDKVPWKSLKMTQGSEQRVSMTINVAKGTPAAALGSISAYPDQNELLLVDGLNYKVVAVDLPSPGHPNAHVTLEVSVPATAIHASSLMGIFAADPNPIGKNQYGPPWKHKPGDLVKFLSGDGSMKTGVVKGWHTSGHMWVQPDGKKTSESVHQQSITPAGEIVPDVVPPPPTTVPSTPTIPTTPPDAGEAEKQLVKGKLPDQSKLPAPKVSAPTDAKTAAKNFLPMQYNEIKVSDLPQYEADAQWFFQQKVDGMRASLVLEPGKSPWVKNKTGSKFASTTGLKTLDPMLAKMKAANLTSPDDHVYIVDGEVLDGKFNVFDWVQLGDEKMPWEKRMAMAETWVKSFNAAGIHEPVALPTARTEEEKKALHEATFNAGSEGIVLKRKDAPYVQSNATGSKRSYDILKAKYVSTADVVVMARNVGVSGPEASDPGATKENATLGVWDASQGKIVPVGSTSMIGMEKKHGPVKVGDVIEVAYLWSSPDNQLSQPRMVGKRPDKTPQMTNLSQLRRVNKGVLDAAVLKTGKSGAVTSDVVDHIEAAISAAIVAASEHDPNPIGKNQYGPPWKHGFDKLSMESPTLQSYLDTHGPSGTNTLPEVVTPETLDKHGAYSKSGFAMYVKHHPELNPTKTGDKSLVGNAAPSPVFSDPAVVKLHAEGKINDEEAQILDDPVTYGEQSKQLMVSTGVLTQAEVDSIGKGHPTPPNYVVGDTVHWTVSGKTQTGTVTHNEASKSYLYVKPAGDENEMSLPKKNITQSEIGKSPDASQTPAEGVALAETAKVGDTLEWTTNGHTYSGVLAEGDSPNAKSLWIKEDGDTDAHQVAKTLITGVTPSQAADASGFKSGDTVKWTSGSQVKHGTVLGPSENDPGSVFVTPSGADYGVSIPEAILEKEALPVPSVSKPAIGAHVSYAYNTLSGGHVTGEGTVTSTSGSLAKITDSTGNKHTVDWHTQLTITEPATSNPSPALKIGDKVTLPDGSTGEVSGFVSGNGNGNVKVLKDGYYTSSIYSPESVKPVPKDDFVPATFKLNSADSSLPKGTPVTFQYFGDTYTGKVNADKGTFYSITDDTTGASVNVDKEDVQPTAAKPASFTPADPGVKKLLKNLTITSPEAKALSDPLTAAATAKQLHDTGSISTADLSTITNPATGKKFSWWDTSAGEAKKNQFKTAATKPVPVTPPPYVVPHLNPTVAKTLTDKFGTNMELVGTKYSHPAIFGAATLGIANKTATPLGDLLANMDHAIGLKPTDGGSFTAEFSSWLQTDKGQNWAKHVHLDGALASAPSDLQMEVAKPSLPTPPSGAVPYKINYVPPDPDGYIPLSAFTKPYTIENPPPPWSASQKASLTYYTGSSYTTINGYLRGVAGYKNAGTPTILNHVKNMQAGMRPLPVGLISRRGTGLDQFGVKTIAQLQALEGKTLQDKGFMSTTLNKKAGFGAIKLTVRVAAGTKAAYVQKTSHFKSENELILTAGTKYKVVKVENGAAAGYGASTTHVILETIPE